MENRVRLFNTTNSTIKLENSGLFLGYVAPGRFSAWLIKSVVEDSKNIQEQIKHKMLTVHSEDEVATVADVVKSEPASPTEELDELEGKFELMEKEDLSEVEEKK